MFKRVSVCFRGASKEGSKEGVDVKIEVVEGRRFDFRGVGVNGDKGADKGRVPSEEEEVGV